MSIINVPLNLAAPLLFTPIEHETHHPNSIRLLKSAHYYVLEHWQHLGRPEIMTVMFFKKEENAMKEWSKLKAEMEQLRINDAATPKK